MAATLSHGFAGAGRWLRKEFVAILPVFLFFLVGFLLLITLIKLTLAQFSVEITVLSNAVIGALLAAKAALVLDETPLARSLEHTPRIIAVAVKVFFYGVASLLLLSVERVLEALPKSHNFDAALRYAFEHATRYRALSWALGISIVFALLRLPRDQGAHGRRGVVETVFRIAQNCHQFGPTFEYWCGQASKLTRLRWMPSTGLA
jgi:hypothetical protein